MIWFYAGFVSVVLFRMLLPTLEEIVWCSFTKKVVDSVLPSTPQVRVKQINSWSPEETRDITGQEVKSYISSYVSHENAWYYIKLWDHTNNKVAWLGRPLPAVLVWLHLFGILLGVRMRYPR